jgi:hypothetical protein
MGFETEDLRTMTRDLNNLHGLDDKLKFFYDETNNIRKYYLKEDKFNESIKSNFILGGIVLEENQDVDIRPLFDSFKLQSNVTEVKLKNLAQGDFFSCLKSIHLKSIFKFMLEKQIFIHYSSLNFLYFSTVDIIDSLIKATGIQYAPFFNRTLKNDLYVCVKRNIDKFISIFYNYEYPNIKTDKVLLFIDDLIEIFKNEPKSSGNNKILMLLGKSKESEYLFYIMNETNHMLIKDFTMFYSRTIYLFLNSIHFFDKEDSIEPLINDLNLTYKECKIENYSFIDSRDNLAIQLSDILVGLIGKYYNALNDYSPQQLIEMLKGLNIYQKETLKLFYEVLEVSEYKNKAYIHLTISNDELSKMVLIKKYT